MAGLCFPFVHMGYLKQPVGPVDEEFWAVNAVFVDEEDELIDCIFLSLKCCCRRLMTAFMERALSVTPAAWITISLNVSKFEGSR